MAAAGQIARNEHLRQPADVDDDLVTAAERVDAVDDLARVDVEPLDLAGASGERHHPDAGPDLGTPPERKRSAIPVVDEADREFQIERGVRSRCDA